MSNSKRTEFLEAIIAADGALVTGLKKELAECQALLKVKDDALDSWVLYIDGRGDITYQEFDHTKVEQALAQTSGTEVLDKLIEEAEQRGYDKCWNEFADAEQVGVWHQGDTEDESDFHIGDAIDAKHCMYCTALIPRPERKEMK